MEKTIQDYNREYQEQKKYTEQLKKDYLSALCVQAYKYAKLQMTRINNDISHGIPYQFGFNDQYQVMNVISAVMSPIPGNPSVLVIPEVKIQAKNVKTGKISERIVDVNKIRLYINPDNIDADAYEF